MTLRHVRCLILVAFCINIATKNQTCSAFEQVTNTVDIVKKPFTLRTANKTHITASPGYRFGESAKSLANSTFRSRFKRSVWHLCEGEVYDCMMCEKEGYYLKILSANYGRSSYNICSWKSNSTKNCQSPNSLDVMRELCDGRQECSFQVCNDNFGGDPCPGIDKYLEFTTSCVAPVRSSFFHAAVLVHTEAAFLFWPSTLSNSNYPFYSMNLVDWFYTIIAQSNQIIQISFSDFELESVLAIFDGASTMAPSLGRYSGNTLPLSAASSQERMYLVFYSDTNSTLTNKRFMARFTYINVTCADGWSTFGSRCIRVYSMERNYSSAETYCNIMGSTNGKHGHLVNIDNSTLQFAILALAPKYSDVFYWIGVDDLQQEGVWRNKYNRTIPWSYWHATEPNGGTRANCAAADSMNDHKWDDIYCSSTHRFICEYIPSEAKMGSNTTTAPVNTTHKTSTSDSWVVIGAAVGFVIGLSTPTFYWIYHRRCRRQHRTQSGVIRQRSSISDVCSRLSARICCDQSANRPVTDTSSAVSHINIRRVRQLCQRISCHCCRDQSTNQSNDTFSQSANYSRRGRDVYYGIRDRFFRDRHAHTRDGTSPIRHTRCLRDMFSWISTCCRREHPVNMPDVSAREYRTRTAAQTPQHSQNSSPVIMERSTLQDMHAAAQQHLGNHVVRNTPRERVATYSRPVSDDYQEDNSPMRLTASVCQDLSAIGHATPRRTRFRDRLMSVHDASSLSAIPNHRYQHAHPPLIIESPFWNRVHDTHEQHPQQAQSPTSETQPDDTLQYLDAQELLEVPNVNHLVNRIVNMFTDDLLENPQVITPLLDTGSGTEGYDVASSECQICMDNPKNCVIVRCGHRATCYECAEIIWRESGRCPICQGKIELIQREYNS